jgi:phosphopantetheinyl transferase
VDHRFPFFLGNGGHHPTAGDRAGFLGCCPDLSGVELKGISRREGIVAGWSVTPDNRHQSAVLFLAGVRFWNQVIAGAAVLDSPVTRADGPAPCQDGGLVYCQVQPVSVGGAVQVWEMRLIDHRNRVIACTGPREFPVPAVLPGSGGPAGGCAARLELDAAANLHRRLGEMVPDCAVLNAKTIEADMEHFQSFLTPLEMEYCQRYIPLRSRVEFCGARVAAKLLLMPHLGADAGQLLDIEIRRGDRQEPVVYWRGTLREDWTVTIAHKDRYVLCGISRAGPIGMDVEKITGTLRQIENQFVTPAEKAFLASFQFDESEYEVMLAKIWTAKESMVKLTRGTFDAVLKDTELVQFAPAWSRYLSRATGETITVQHHVQGDYMFAGTAKRG